MIGCPTCRPSDIACLKHCPGWLLAMMPAKKRAEILRKRRRSHNGGVQK